MAEHGRNSRGIREDAEEIRGAVEGGPGRPYGKLSLKGLKYCTRSTSTGRLVVGQVVRLVGSCQWTNERSKKWTTVRLLLRLVVYVHENAGPRPGTRQQKTLTVTPRLAYRHLAQRHWAGRSCGHKPYVTKSPRPRLRPRSWPWVAAAGELSRVAGRACLARHSCRVAAAWWPAAGAAA